MEQVANEQTYHLMVSKQRRPGIPVTPEEKRVRCRLLKKNTLYSSVQKYQHSARIKQNERYTAF